MATFKVGFLDCGIIPRIVFSELQYPIEVPHLEPKCDRQVLALNASEDLLGLIVLALIRQDFGLLLLLVVEVTYALDHLQSCIVVKLEEGFLGRGEVELIESLESERAPKCLRGSFLNHAEYFPRSGFLHLLTHLTELLALVLHEEIA